MNKRQTRKIIAALRRERRRYAKLKKECAQRYPDWRDDEFNMLDNKFIWGFTTTDFIPSYLTWDDAYIYYNRTYSTYHLVLDLRFCARDEFECLVEIKNAFRDFLIENSIPLNIEKHIGAHEVNFEAESLSELYVKLNILIEGYETYYKSQVKLN